MQQGVFGPSLRWPNSGRSMEANMAGFKDENEHRQYLFTKAAECGIPDYMQTGLVEYIMTARPVGHFLTAVFENNLYQAVNRGDERNREHLADYIFFLHNHAPHACWGEPNVGATWRERGGLRKLLYEKTDVQG